MMTEAIRIAVLNFVHETVTFLPNDTTLDDFVHDGSPARGEALLAWEPQSYMGGFVKVARDAWPVVLADHSDRSGSATWLLQQVIAQDLADVLIATVADRAAVGAVVAKGLKAGDPFDMDVGGLADESAGQPVRIKGTIGGVGQIARRHWVSVAFGRGNVVLISEYLTQVMDPLDLTGPGFTIDQFKVFAIKSRV